MISPNQCAFVKGRNISDNSNLAEELLRGFQQQATPKRACIVVDLRKAFDSISWGRQRAHWWGIGTGFRDVYFLRWCLTMFNKSPTNLFGMVEGGELETNG